MYILQVQYEVRIQPDSDLRGRRVVGSFHYPRGPMGDECHEVWTHERPPRVPEVYG
jgi:hypothetical protein